MIGLYRSRIDGIDGPKTERAILEFTQNEGLTGDVEKLLLEKIKRLPVTDYDSRDGTELADIVKKLCTEMYHKEKMQWAYIMATVEHETAGTYYPVREAFYLGKEQQLRYLKKKKYYPYYGRGLVQLTWLFNYEKYSDILSLDLTSHPDNALDPALSLFILVHGMLTGAFTGLPLDKFINDKYLDLSGARRVVNGTDRADHIAGLANKWVKHYE